MAFFSPKSEEPLDLSVRDNVPRKLVLPYSWGYPVYPGYPIHIPVPEPSPAWSNTCRPYIVKPISQVVEEIPLPLARSGIISPPKQHGMMSSPIRPGLISPPVRPWLMSPPESPNNRREFALLDDEDNLSDDPEFQNYKTDALQAMAEKNGGSLLGHNPRMRRSVQTTHGADDAYRQQRDKNNIAAKQSRDRRKLRELHSALKVSYLKKKLARVKALLAAQECGLCQRRCDA